MPWHGRDGQMRHPRSMGGAEVTQFLAMLANERRVSGSTHNQALSALLFLYRQVLASNAGDWSNSSPDSSTAIDDTNSLAHIPCASKMV